MPIQVEPNDWEMWFSVSYEIIGPAVQRKENFAKGGLAIVAIKIYCQPSSDGGGEMGGMGDGWVGEWMEIWLAGLGLWWTEIVSTLMYLSGQCPP